MVGAGPNGLAAAITLAQAGVKTVLREAQATVGGGLRSDELTLPGFVHDVCSAVHALALGSPFLRTLPLERFGLEWVQPSAALAHPLDDGSAALLERSLDATAARRFGLGYALRGLSRDRATVTVLDISGGLATGTIDAVGADHLQVALHHGDQPRRAPNVQAGRAIPFRALVSVSTG